MSKRPKSVMCYICGREFGTTSLKIHIKSCEKKWDQEQQRMQENPKKRKPCPQAPPNFDDIILVAQGKKPKSALDSADDSRGFNTGGQDLSLQAYNDAAFNEYNTKVLDECKHCGRTFKPEALVHHANSCTAEKPLKKRLIRPVKQSDDGNAEAINKQEEEKQSDPVRRQSAMPKKESMAKMKSAEAKKESMAKMETVETQMKAAEAKMEAAEAKMKAAEAKMEAADAKMEATMPKKESLDQRYAPEAIYKPQTKQTLMPRMESKSKIEQIIPKMKEDRTRMPRRENMAKMQINETPQEDGQKRIPKRVISAKAQHGYGEKKMPRRENMAKMTINEDPQEQPQMGGSKLKKPSSLAQGSSIGKGSRIGQGSKKKL